MEGEQPQGLTAGEAGLAALRDARAESAGAQQPLERRKVDHRILGLAVHGIGSQKVGSSVEDVVGAIYPLVRTIDPTASIAVKPLDEGDPADARIWFSANGENYELRCFEVWWAEAFQPPSFGDFVSGVLSCVRAGWRRQGARGALWPLWRDRGWGLAFWQRLVIEAGALLLAPLVILALLVLWLIDALVPKFVLGAAIAKPIASLIGALTGRFGDLIVYMKDPWEASRIRVRFEQRFYQLIDLIDPVTDAVFVVAHSMGGVVSFEALTGGRMSDAIEAKFAERGKGTGGTPSLHFITVGSALNMAWDLAPMSEHYRFYREKIPAQIRWLDLWSQQDPGPRGKLRAPKGIPKDQYETKMVMNRMSVVQDHTSYWGNVAEVVAGILREITGTKLKDELKMNVAGHRSRVQVFGAALMGVLLVFPITFFVVLSTGAGECISEWIDAGFVGDKSWREYFVSPLLWSLAVGGVAVLIYHSAANWLWALWDGARRYGRMEE